MKNDWFRHNIHVMCTAAFVAAWATIFLLRQIPVGGVWLPLDQQTNFFVFFWVLATALALLAGGCVARRLSRYTSRKPGALEEGADLAVLILSLAALIGAILIILEFVYVRNYGFSMPVTDIRILEVNRGMKGAASSLISGPGRLMVPAILPAIILVVWRWKSLSWFSVFVFALACFVVLVEQVKFEGGRIFLGSTFIALGVALFVDLFRIAKLERHSFSRKLINSVLILGLYGSLVISYSGWVFNNRAEASGESQSAAFNRFSSQMIGETQVPDGGAATLTGEELPEVIIESPLDTPSAVTSLLGSPATQFFWLYATHGISELSKVLKFKNLEHTNGFFQFPQASQILDRLFGTNLRVDYYHNLPSIGLYTTMIGASYIDFGWLGAVMFGIGFGFFTGCCSTSAMQQGNLSFTAIAFPPLMTVALVSPVVSIVNHVWPMIVWALLAALAARFAENKSRTSMIAV